MTWRWAEAAAGREQVVDLLLGGAFPCYRVYRCGDGELMAVSALEPKFWIGFVTMLGAEELDQAGFAMGEEAAATVARVEEILSGHPRDHWLDLAAKRGLPLSAVHPAGSAAGDPVFARAGLTEELPMPGGDVMDAIGPWLTGIGRTPESPAPALGEHTDAVIAEIS